MVANTDKKHELRDRVRSWRHRMRARGFRPVQVWVPDTRTAAFRSEAHRQSLAVARSRHAREDQEFIGVISDADDA